MSQELISVSATSNTQPEYFHFPLDVMLVYYRLTPGILVYFPESSLVSTDIPKKDIVD